MITLALEILAFARKYWRVVVPLLALAALLIGAGLWVRSYGNERCEVCRRSVVAEYQQQLIEANARVAAAEAMADEISRRKDIEFQEERNALHNQIDDLLSRGEPIRMCRPARRAERAEVSETTTEPDATDGHAEHGLQAGRDLRSDLVRFAGECEGYRQQVISLQEWIQDQRAVP